MKINQQHRFCRYCEEVLPTYLAKNVWYHEECLTESKRERSNKYYKDNLNDSLLGVYLNRFGAGNPIDCRLLINDNYAWESFVNREMIDGLQHIYLNNYYFILYDNNTIEIYQNGTNNKHTRIPITI